MPDTLQPPTPPTPPSRPPPTSPLSKPPVSTRPQHRSPGLLFLAIALLVMGTLGFYIISRSFDALQRVAELPRDLATSLADAFKPTVTYTTVINTAIGELNHRPKLVVLTANVDAEVIKTSATNWGYMYWGTTRVALRAHENKIQYIVHLDRITADNFRYDDAAKKVFLQVPPPVLDVAMVSVQSDPAKIEVQTDNGWAMFDRWSGAPLREEAQHDLRPAVIAAGAHQLLSTQARTNARDQLQKLLAPLAEALQPGITLEIEFKRPP